MKIETAWVSPPQSIGGLDRVNETDPPALEVILFINIGATARRYSPEAYDLVAL